MTLISVIIPFYNPDEEFFKECLNSILNQNLQNFEILCVDDGSANCLSSEILNLIDSDSRIKLYRQKHKGAGPARNLGIKKSCGEYIVFMDADDYYPDNNVLEDLYNCAEETNLEVCGGKALNRTNNNSLEAPFWRFKNYENLFTNQITNIYDFQICWGYWCFIYKRNFLIKNNLFFPSYLRYQDPPWFIKTLWTAKNYFAMNRITYIHREPQKAYIWNNLALKDYFNGILDVLKFTNKMQLKELHIFIYRKFLTYDIHILIKHLQPSLFLNINRISDGIFQSVNKKYLSESSELIPYFKNYNDYKLNIKKYNLQDY